MDPERRALLIRGIGLATAAFALPSCASPPRASDAEAKDWEESFKRRDAWEAQLGKPVAIEGIARNQKLGATVGELWVDGLQGWPDDLVGKKVRVTGTLVRRDDLPVFHPDPDEHPIAGIPVPAGVDLEKAARRYLIAQARWTAIGD